MRMRLYSLLVNCRLALSALATLAFLLPCPTLRAQNDVLVPDLPLGTGGGGSLLPNGWKITPVGRAVPLPGDLPMNMVVSPDGTSLVVSTCGAHDQDVDVIDLATGRLTQSINVDKNWAGLCFNSAGTDVYLAAGQGYDSELLAQGANAGLSPNRLSSMQKTVLHFGWTGSWLTLKPDMAIPALSGRERWTAGAATGSDGSLYVLEMEDNAVYKLGTDPPGVVATGKVGYRPYAVALSPDRRTLAVSNWGDSSVSLLAADSLKETARIAVGRHPSALAWADDGRLFVADAGTNGVSVIRDGHAVEAISTALAAGDPIGSTPDALALAPDGSRLYVADADNNDIAVVDTTNANQSRVLGFIPTGWYPCALAVSADGRQLYVGTGKGLRFRPNVPAIAADPRTTVDGQRKFDDISHVLSGAVSIVDIPDAAHLADDTRQVHANVPTPGGGSAAQTDALSQIKHVLYIIREGRSYDQVFGDMPGGNGDSSLALFGRNVTPNAHALAQRYALLDNFYSNGEVSEDGHAWCDAAYATDFTEKVWPGNYSGRDEPDADERLRVSPAGALWDACALHGISYFSYGEQARFQPAPGNAFLFTGAHALVGHASPAWSMISPDRHDTDRAGVFLSDLHTAERTGVWPKLTVMSLGEDSTQGLASGKYTPLAQIAANDAALGQIVDAVSHSPFWHSTAIFVVEASAEDGPDHIDAHRTVGLVISPYVQRQTVDHTFYTTASFVRTIEMILGLPPLSQFDAHATPLTDLISEQPDATPYNALPARISLTTRNP